MARLLPSAAALLTLAPRSRLARAAAACAMPDAASIVTTLKQVSQAGLLLSVAIGAILYDGRFTMLIVPPFVYMYGQTGDLQRVPLVRFLSNPITWNLACLLGGVVVTDYVFDLGIVEKYIADPKEFWSWDGVKADSKAAK